MNVASRLPVEETVPDGMPTPRRYWAMAAIFAGIITAVVDQFIANVALPAIATDLNAPPAATIAVVSAYQIAMVALLLPAAALGELIGYHKVYLAGVLLFVASSLICSSAPNLEILIFGRALQGIGAAGLMSVNAALVRVIYPSRMLGRGMAFNALVVAMSAAAGPTIASAILSVGSWRWLFAVNIPVGVLTVIIGYFALPRPRPRAEGFDLLSAILNALTFGLLVLGLEMLAQDGDRRWPVFLMSLAVAAGVALIWRSLAQKHPMIPLDLLRRPEFAMTAGTAVICFFAQGLGLVALPFLLHSVLGRAAVEIGLLMTPWPLAVAVAAMIAGRMADRNYPTGYLVAFGLSCLSAGLAYFALIGTGAGTAAIIAGMILCGIGFGFYQTPNARGFLTGAPRDRAGAASGMLAMTRLTGQTAGATTAALMFHSFGLPAARYCLALGAALALAGVGLNFLRAQRASGARRP